jgi:hypothetical protein
MGAKKKGQARAPPSSDRKYPGGRTAPRRRPPAPRRKGGNCPDSRSPLPAAALTLRSPETPRQGEAGADRAGGSAAWGMPQRGATPHRAVLQGSVNPPARRLPPNGPRARGAEARQTAPARLPPPAHPRPHTPAPTLRPPEHPHGPRRPPRRAPLLPRHPARSPRGRPLRPLGPPRLSRRRPPRRPQARLPEPLARRPPRRLPQHRRSPRHSLRPGTPPLHRRLSRPQLELLHPHPPRAAAPPGLPRAARLPAPQTAHADQSRETAAPAQRNTPQRGGRERVDGAPVSPRAAARERPRRTAPPAPPPSPADAPAPPGRAGGRGLSS